MGFYTFFYANPDDTLYAWMQRVYPDYSAWVQEQVDKADETMILYIEPRPIEIVKALDGYLPAEPEFRQRFSHADAVVLLKSIYFIFDDLISLKATRSWQLKEIGYFRKSLAYYHFGQLSRVFERALNQPPIVNLLGAYGGRVFLDSEDTCDEYMDLPLMFWSNEECLEIRQALAPIFDSAQPEYLEHEVKLRAWFLLDEDIREDDPVINLSEICVISQRLDSALAALPDGEGVVVRFSY